MNRAFPRGASVLSIWLMVAVFPYLGANRCLAAQGGEPGEGTSETCELRIEGRLIEKLILVDRRGAPHEIDRPKGSVSLPPGKYRIQQVTLEDGYSHVPRGQEGWFSLTPGRTHPLAVGAPLRSQLDLKRTGRTFQLNHRLVDGEGRLYFRGLAGLLDPPQFTVRQGGRQIGSGTFEYG